MLHNFLIDDKQRRLPVTTQEQDKMQDPKIAFGVLSCRDSSDAITQLADAVHPHRVIVHHDFSKHYDFDIERPNVIIMPKPINTAWAGWSLVEASILLMHEAMRDPTCTHFQLLSESCLPIRPIKDFESYLRMTCPDAMIDFALLTNPGSDILLSHGWRYLTRTQRAMQIAVKSRDWWLGRERTAKQIGSLNCVLSLPETTLIRRLRQRLGKLVFKMTIAGGSGFPSDEYVDCYVGGQWFGVSRRVAELLLKVPEDHPKIVAHFSRCFIPDEAYFHTLIGNMNLLRIAASNHAVFWTFGNSGPNTLDESYLERLTSSGKYFARKFPLNAEAPIRLQVLQMIKTSTNGKPFDSVAKE